MVSDDAKAPAPQGDDLKLDTPVTTVIRQPPRPDAVDRYENWLKEIIPVAQQFAGHRSVNVIRPHGASGEYTIVLHFDTIANLRKWLNSDVRGQLIDQIRPSLSTEEKIDIKTGLEFWFTPPPGGKPARPYKQFFVTLSAIFPLTILVPWLLQPKRPWRELPITVRVYCAGHISLKLLGWQSASCLADIPDRRRAEGKMYGQVGVIMFSIIAMLSGARSYRQIHTLIDRRLAILNAAFPQAALRRSPAYTSVRGILQRLDPAELERAFRRHAEGLDQSCAAAPSRFIAIDGKTLRQSFDAFADRKAAMGCFAGRERACYFILFSHWQSKRGAQHAEPTRPCSWIA